MESGEKKGAFLATVSFMGGTFGLSDKSFETSAVYGGLAGLVKTAAIEFNHVLCRALDLPDTADMCKRNTEAAVALMMTHGDVEMGIDGDSCNIPQLIEKPVKEGGFALSRQDVVVVTGGAKGVTAACAVALSQKCESKIALIGRSAVLTDEPSWARGINSPSGLKKAILENRFKGEKATPAMVEAVFREIISSRMINETLAKIRAAGTTAAYFSADVRDKQQIGQIFEQVQEKMGKVSCIIHGAGVLEDKRIVDKNMDAFDRVLMTKIQGLENILAIVDPDELKYLVLFSSVAARTGNQGQSDYAMANEVLNKTAGQFSRSYPDCRVLSINWGPWEGGMVDASLKKEFEKRGIELIPVEAGVQHLMAEMSNTHHQGPEIVVGAHLVKAPEPGKTKLSEVMTIDFDRVGVPVLESHRIAGEPVVPFALILENLALAAQKDNPGLLLASMDDVRLLKGIRPGDGNVRASLNIGKCRPCSSGFETMGTLTSKGDEGTTYTHSSARLILKEKRQKPPVLSKAAFMSLKTYERPVDEIYRNILFHGKDLYAVKSINGWSEKGIEITACLAPSPDQWISQPKHPTWVLEPMILDAAFQAAILWLYEESGQVCLPTYIENLRLYSSFDHLNSDVRILFTVNEQTKSKIRGYFTFLNADDVVVASIMGFEAVTDPSLLESFKNKPLFSKDSILEFAQGVPSRAFGGKYAVFDEQRQIARLPRPPYFFMDRVLSADHPQWEMKPGGYIQTEYDIPAGEWFFTANRTQTMPFCILLEIALQPCGWLAAYAGSALQSEDRLHFRNLGGKATLHRLVDRQAGTLKVRCRMKEVSKAGGMIIQDFDMQVLNNGKPVYEGTTNFGFFTKKALSNQVGIRNSKLAGFQPKIDTKAVLRDIVLEETAPFVPGDSARDADNGMPSKALQMIDTIELLDENGGLYDNGYIKAAKTIDPKEWFFDAHFYQDPVCPGSLGIESFLQVIRYFMLHTFKIDPKEYTPGLVPGQTHEWIYRGQIIPSNKKVEVHVHIKSAQADKAGVTVSADGALTVDGICIYEMQNFVLAFHKQKNQPLRLKKTEKKTKRKI